MELTDDFTAKHVHTCFHWIAGTTLFHRVSKGWNPTSNLRRPGRGRSYRFSLEGLVHIGVIDELCALGAWRDGVELTANQIEFVPEPMEREAFERERQREPGKSANALEAKMREALRFYRFQNYFCRIIVDILHRPEANSGALRSKRSPRLFRVKFCFDPDNSNDPNAKDYTRLGNRIWGTECWSSATIEVYRIYSYVTHTLRLGPDYDEIWEEVRRRLQEGGDT